jgi:hypothetical protein
VGAADHRREAEQKLDDHEPRRWIVLGRRVHDQRHAVQEQRVERVLGLHASAAAQRRDDIAAIAEQEDDRGDDLEAVGHAEPEHEPDGEEPEEDGEVALHGLGVDVEAVAGRAPALVGERRNADEEHRDRREQERGPDDRADRDVVGPLRPAEDRDERDQALGHRRPDGGEQAPHRAFAERQLVPEPLDGVREGERPDEDHREAHGEQEYLA